MCYTSTGKVITAPVADRKVKKLALMYNKLNERVRCATAKCCGYKIPYGLSGSGIEKGLSPMYRYSLCNSNNGFNATMTTSRGSLQVAGDY